MSFTRTVYLHISQWCLRVLSPWMCVDQLVPLVCFLCPHPTCCVLYLLDWWTLGSPAPPQSKVEGCCSTRKSGHFGEDVHPNRKKPEKEEYWKAPVFDEQACGPITRSQGLRSEQPPLAKSINIVIQTPFWLVISDMTSQNTHRITRLMNFEPSTSRKVDSHFRLVSKLKTTSL